MQSGKHLKHRVIEQMNLTHLLKLFSAQQLALTFNVSVEYIGKQALINSGEVLRDYDTAFKMPELNKAVDIVCGHFLVNRSQLKHSSRVREYAEPRKLLYYILYYKFRQSPSLIGRYFNRTHSNVITLAKNTQDRMEVDKQFREEVNEILTKIECYD